MIIKYKNNTAVVQNIIHTFFRTNVITKAVMVPNKKTIVISSRTNTKKKISLFSFSIRPNSCLFFIIIALYFRVFLGGL